MLKNAPCYAHRNAHLKSRAVHRDSKGKRLNCASMILPSASSLAWLMATTAAVAYLVPAALASRTSASASRIVMAPAWLLHAMTLAWGLLSDTPHFGFAPALSMTVWLVSSTYAIERELFPQMQARRALPVLSLVAAFAIVGAATFPGLPLPLSASAWLALHLTLGIACYGLFATAVVHAWLMGRAEHQIRLAAENRSGIPLLMLERLTFRFVTAGFVLLSATLAAGWLFGDTLYGHAWQWSHKAIFSLLAWLIFAVLLLGRMRFGWRGRTAARMLYAGSALLLLAYVGSRFVLEVVLEKAA